MDRSERGPIAVILADVDYFKVVNDTRGHLAGDEVLKEISRRLRSHARASDAVGRYGGEEFLVVLHPCDAVQVAHAAERLRRAVAETDFEVSGGAPLTVTMSLGTAATTSGCDSVSSLLKSAADALYRAKKAGRNCVRAGATP